MFLVEGVSYHSFLLDLSGGELLTMAYVLATLRSAKVTNIVFVFTFAFQILICVFFGHSLVGHWIQVSTGLVSVMAIQALVRKASANHHQQQKAQSLKGNRMRGMIQQIQAGTVNINSTSKNFLHHLHNNARQREQQEKIFQEYQHRQQRHFFQVRMQRERMKQKVAAVAPAENAAAAAAASNVERDTKNGGNKKAMKQENTSRRGSGSRKDNENASVSLSSKKDFVNSILGEKAIKRGATIGRSSAVRDTEVNRQIQGRAQLRRRGVAGRRK
jgi:hypothetical protein